MSEPTHNSASEQSPHDDLQLLTTEEVARLLLVSPRVVREMALGGELEASWIGRGYRFRRSAVEAAIENRRIASVSGTPPRPRAARRNSVTGLRSRPSVVPPRRHRAEKAPRKGVLTSLLKDEP